MMLNFVYFFFTFSFYQWYLLFNKLVLNYSFKKICDFLSFHNNTLTKSISPGTPTISSLWPLSFDLVTDALGFCCSLPSRFRRSIILTTWFFIFETRIFSLVSSKLILTSRLVRKPCVDLPTHSVAEIIMQNITDIKIGKGTPKADGALMVFYNTGLITLQYSI